MMLFFKELLAHIKHALEAYLACKKWPLTSHATQANLVLGGMALVSLTLPVSAQTSVQTSAITNALHRHDTSTAMPFYSTEQAVTGIYAYHLPPLSTRFVTEADALVVATHQYCQALPTLAASHSPQQAAWTPLYAQWLRTMAAWEGLSTPAIGPAVLRRSQRQIDFWPTRLELANKALGKAPQTLADMERIGTLAKGLPAMELLLAQWQTAEPGRGRGVEGRTLLRGKPSPKRSDVPPTRPAATCHYLSLLAQGIQLEANELHADLGSRAAKDWPASAEDTTAALAEWHNQWLAGVERLRWTHIEKPIKSTLTVGNTMKAKPVPFARLTRAANLAGWRAQWHSLLAQARLMPDQAQKPPLPGQALIPIEALLLSKGHIALAQRWVSALDVVSARIDALPPQAPSQIVDQRELLALTSALKAVTVLFQNDVASALDISLGFSDADGD